MPQSARIWQIEDDETLREIESRAVDLEAQLEDWLEEDISVLSEDLLIIGRQVSTDFGGKIDLLCIDPAGDLVVVELKRNKTPREVVAQGLDYASWVVDLSSEDVRDQADHYLDGEETLDSGFREAFDAPLPDVINEGHRILVVGAEIDAQSERIIEYLSDEHGVDINAATFQYFEDDEAGRILSRVFTIAPEQVQVRARRKGTSKRTPPPAVEEMEQRAEQQGVADWYRRIVAGLETEFKTETTQSALGFTADFRETNFPRELGRVLNLLPDPEGGRGDGLHFQIYTYRLASLCGVDESQVRELLPKDRNDDWQYDAREDFDGEWSGSEGYFRSDEGVETFLNGMKDLLDV
jgi:hypothetical protein